MKSEKSVRLCVAEIDEETGNMTIFDEGGGESGQNQSVHGRKGKLTVCSQKYDMAGKGYLNPVELAMRKADKEGTGELSKEEVYHIMEGYMNMKKMVIVMSVFTLLIVIAIVGTSIGVARLTKQIDTQSSGVMFVDGSDKRVKVEGDLAVRQLDMGAAPPATRDRLRRLQANAWENVPNSCTVVGEAPGTFVTDAITDLKAGAMSRVQQASVNGDITAITVNIVAWCSTPNPDSSLSAYPYLAVHRDTIPSVDTDGNECNRIQVYLKDATTPATAENYQRYHCCVADTPCVSACYLSGACVGNNTIVEGSEL